MKGNKNSPFFNLPVTYDMSMSRAKNKQFFNTLAYFKRDRFGKVPRDWRQMVREFRKTVSICPPLTPLSILTLFLGTKM